MGEASSSTGQLGKRVRRAGRRSAAFVFLVLAVAACAPRQFVPVRIEPAPDEIFLDREPIELDEGGLRLRADRPHVLYFKREGYQPLPVVIESRETPDGPRLEPARVEGRLRPRSAGEGDVEIEEVDEP